MWIREVDLPEPLVEAAQSGDIVLFVGAGASMDTPSDLPSFRRLTAEVANEANVSLTDTELDQPDVALGRIMDLGVDVHHRVAARINAPGSAPNALHEAIAELAYASGVPRIVTTNYDRHLSTTLRARYGTITEYKAPALPMGDDFSGIVYLHGSLNQPTRHLVMTDRDFGRAYLRDAWAARFLERMFSKYAVLFVGYSHGDVVMRYLARSLTSQSRRYALTGDSDASHWLPLNIEAIPYPVIDKSHGALPPAMSGWAQLLSMRLLDHRQRLAHLLAGSPPGTPEDISYLEATLADGDRTRMFCELARGEEWLRWVAKQPSFRALFDPRSTPSDSSIALCYWFTGRFVANEDLTNSALETVRDAGGRWSEALWYAVGGELHRHEKPRPRWLDPWLVLMLENAPADGGDWMEYALTASRLPEDTDAVLLMFDHLTKPVVGFQPSYGLGGQPRFHISLRGSKHWLNEAWNDLLQPNIAHIVDPVLAIAERHLRSANQILCLAGSANAGWDPVSFDRSSISPHAQDTYRDDLDILIDAARDCLRYLLESGRQAPIDSWADSDVPILRRLAVYGWTHRSDVTDDERLFWIVNRAWLHDHQLRHEVFELIAAALPGASPEARGAVLEQADSGPRDVEGADVREYERFNALAWLNRHSDDGAISEAFEAIQNENPEFRVRQHPDLLSWSEGGSVVSQPPMTVDELHERLEGDAAGTLHWLREFESAQSPWEGPTWGDTTRLVTEAVTTFPEDGFTVVEAEGDLATDLSTAAIRGWAHAELTEDDTRSVLGVFERLPWQEVADVVAWMLGETGSDQGGPSWHRFHEARRLAAEAWDVIASPPVEDGLPDWLSRAINTSAGRLAQFWVKAVQHDWRAAGDEWNGIPDELRVELDRQIRGEDSNSHMAQVIFASQMLFFFSADRNWCTERVMPLLKWSDLATARRAWDGFLIWGRWNDATLSAGMLDGYLIAATRRTHLRDEAFERLADHLADIAIYSGTNPLTWASRLTTEADRDFVTDWLRRVSWTLGRLTPEAVEEQWDRWLRDYWQGRLDSVPRSLTHPEASAMCGWIVHLTTSADEAVGLALQHECGIEPHGNLLHDLKDRVETDPLSFGRFVAHVLSGTAPDQFWECHNLRAIVEKLIGHAESQAVLRIREQCLRLGCVGAADW